MVRKKNLVNIIEEYQSISYNTAWANEAAFLKVKHSLYMTQVIFRMVKVSFSW